MKRARRADGLLDADPLPRPPSRGLIEAVFE